jgi:hypothetical protein
MCSTEQGLKVYAHVEHWMDTHPDVPGIWNVFEDPLGPAVTVSIHQPDGVRRLTLPDQQSAATFTHEIGQRIQGWLDNLSFQPIVVRGVR